MVKLVGSIVLVSMTTLLGYMESYKLRMRVETLESFLKVIRLMETEMRFHALPLRQIIDKYCGDMDCSKQEKVLMRHGKVV